MTSRTSTPGSPTPATTTRGASAPRSAPGFLEAADASTRDIGDDAITDYYNISATPRAQLLADPPLRTLAWARPDRFGHRPGDLPAAVSRRESPVCGTGWRHGRSGRAPVRRRDDLRRTERRRSETPELRPCLPGTPRPALTSDQLATSGLWPAGPEDGVHRVRRAPRAGSSGSLVALDDSSFGNWTRRTLRGPRLIKEWERWRGELSYERSADESGSFGATA